MVFIISCHGCPGITVKLSSVVHSAWAEQASFLRELIESDYEDWALHNDKYDVYSDEHIAAWVVLNPNVFILNTCKYSILLFQSEHANKSNNELQDCNHKVEDSEAFSLPPKLKNKLLIRSEFINLRSYPWLSKML